MISLALMGFPPFGVGPAPLAGYFTADGGFCQFLRVKKTLPDLTKKEPGGYNIE